MKATSWAVLYRFLVSSHAKKNSIQKSLLAVTPEFFMRLEWMSICVEESETGSCKWVSTPKKMRFLGKLMFKRRKRGLVHGNFLHYTPRKVLVGVARHAGAMLQPENSTSLENIQWKLSTYVTNGICLIIFSAPIAEYIHACSNTG